MRNIVPVVDVLSAEPITVATIPVKRLGESADVARAANVFTHPLNSFVTCQVLCVCDGTRVGGLALLPPFPNYALDRRC